MKKVIRYGMFLLFALSCSRETSGIRVKLERPMYNRLLIQPPGEEAFDLDLPERKKTLIFDIEQMTSVEATIRGGDVRYRRSHFRIALVDYNNNGRFDDTGVDKFLLERHGRDSARLIYPLRPLLAPLQAYTQFRVDQQLFEIADVDPDGRSLEIYPIGRSDILNPIIFNTRLPNFQVRDSTGQTLRLSELQEPGKPLVIVLWQNRYHVWDRVVEEILPASAEERMGYTLIGLHIPDSSPRQPNLKSIEAWLQGRMPLYWGESRHALELNNGDQFPSLIYFNAEGEWMGSGLPAEEILEAKQ